MGPIGRGMDGEAGKAKRYRQRAEGLRKIADGLPEGSRKRIVLSIALEYEQLARLLVESDMSDAPASARAALKKPEDLG